jgi:hypothetical protein
MIEKKIKQYLTEAKEAPSEIILVDYKSIIGYEEDVPCCHSCKHYIPETDATGSCDNDNVFLAIAKKKGWGDDPEWVLMDTAPQDKCKFFKKDM